MDTAWLPVGFALLDWIGIRLRWDRLQPVTKPAVMLAVLAWILIAGPGLGTPIVWFFAGGLFSLVGDILLLPTLNRFPAGLAAFLAAHLAYIIGLNTTPFPVNASTFLLAVIVALLTFRAARVLVAALDPSGHPALKTPVRIYTLVLALSLLSGLSTLARDAWAPGPALLAAGGTLLLTISDILLAQNRFSIASAGARLKVRISYHTGQLMLIGAALLFFSSNSPS